MNAKPALSPAETLTVGGNRSLAADAPTSGVLPLDGPTLEALVADALARGDGTQLRAAIRALRAAEALARRHEAMGPLGHRIDLARVAQLFDAVRAALRQANEGEGL